MPLLHARLTALALLGAFALPASAQQTAHCDGVLKTNSAYSNVLPNGSTAQVEYHLQLQNLDPQRRSLTATMQAMSHMGRYQVLRPLSSLTLGAYQQKDAIVMVLQTSHPAGVGAPSPATVANTVRFTCTFS